MERSAPSQSALAVPAAGIALLVVGSFGTWVKIGPATGDGLSRDGVITLILAILAAVFLAFAGLRRRAPSRIALGICAVLALATSIYDVIDVSGSDVGVFEATVGWGLWVCLVGSVVLAAGVTVARR
ncbi:MAG: hypothetical protein QOI80_505 [Solirubrobacteraceae bacterium]|jgi:peptidoglycan/LPS O-acetylase OafA/YrhL|nr:hypothetical protein [Solirubrobacteraceae bacterium]